MAMLAALLFLFLTAALVSPTIGGDTITPGQPLTDGEILISTGSRFALGFFNRNGSDNRYVGIWYHGIADGNKTVVWVANRQRPVVGHSGRLSLASNGTLVITVNNDNNSTVIWWSNSPAVGSPVAQLCHDGNFVVSDSGSSSAVWQSFDFPTDTLLAGMRLGWNRTSPHNTNLTAWKSDSDPAPGDFVAAIDLNGNPQLYIFSGTHKYCRVGSWNGERLIGAEGMKRDANYGLYFKFDMDPAQLFYHCSNNSIVNRVVLDYTGTMSNLWLDEKNNWQTTWKVPRDDCDNFAHCGPYGVCHNSGPTTYCECPDKFLQRNPQKWSDGCKRKTALDCRAGLPQMTDGFAKKTDVKLPDTASSTVNWSATLEQCMATCLKNCSCMAYALANISGSGSGCITWTTELTDTKSLEPGEGQDLYVRLDAADLESTQSRLSHTVIIIIILLLVLAIFFLAGSAYRIWKRRKSIEETQDEDFELPLFNLATIVDATGNFKTENKLGEGGFGPVYKGNLSDGHEIAVKRLSKTSSQGVREFKNEVLLIAELQHRNLVRLLGCCIQGRERMLIYEYMPNGSLDSFLFDSDEAKSALLEWPTRFNIIVGIARALLYLHHDSRLTIIHRDLKASNVLLDKDMNPKISDFGMARIFGGDDSEANTIRVVGTFGYMSPEYAMNGIFSIKSDVFSFGVLVLEIITGIRNKRNSHFLIDQNLLEYVWSLWKADRALEAIDRTIGTSFDKGEALSCLKIGLLCIQERPGDRPTIYSVLKMLGNDSVLLPEPKEPSVFTLRASSEVSSSTSRRLTSINNISLTMLNAR